MRSRSTWRLLFEPIKNLSQIVRTNRLFWGKTLIGCSLAAAFMRSIIPYILIHVIVHVRLSFRVLLEKREEARW